MSADGVFDFGLRLRRLRKDRGMSRASLAKRLDVSKETVYRYEDNLQDPALNRMKRNLSLIHISEPTRPRLISYAVFCLKK